MSLSERDQRALAQIEGALHRDDPRFSALIAGDRFQRRQRRWISIPAVLSGIGAVLFVAGLVTTDADLGLGLGVVVVGLLIMTAAVTLLYRHRHELPVPLVRRPDH